MMTEEHKKLEDPSLFPVIGALYQFEANAGGNIPSILRRIARRGG